MLQRWLRICWKWCTLWKACNKQNTWRCWTCLGCNQQRSETDSVRSRSSSGDSKNYCAWDIDAGSWHETYHGKICSVASVTKGEGTINKEYYLNVLCWLRDAIQWKWLHLWATGDWQLHHNNTPTHTSHLMQHFWWNIKSPRWVSPANSPDFVPRNFWLFLKLKSPLKGKRFHAVDEIQENTMGQLMVIATKNFAECLE